MWQMPKISKKNASTFAMLIKNQIGEYCQEHRADYIEFLKSIADVDEQARSELERLTSQEVTEVTEKKMEDKNDKSSI